MKLIKENDCEKCEMHWWDKDYWGEYDEGCRIDRDVYPERCYLPKTIRKILLLQKKYYDWKAYRAYKREEKKWTKAGSNEDEWFS